MSAGFADEEGQRVLAALQQLEKSLSSLSCRSSHTDSATTSPGTDFTADELDQILLDVERGLAVSEPQHDWYQGLVESSSALTSLRGPCAETDNSLFLSEEALEVELPPEGGHQILSGCLSPVGEAADPEDEWQDDDDPGYVMVPVTEEEMQRLQDEAEAHASRMGDLEQSMFTWHSASSPDKDDERRLPSSSPPLSPDAAAESFAEEGSLEMSPGGILEAVDEEGLLVAEEEAPLEVSSQAAESESESEEPPTQPTPFRGSRFSKRVSEVMGQSVYRGIDGLHSYFNLKVIFEPRATGASGGRDFEGTCGAVIAGRYQVMESMASGAFATAYQCVDAESIEDGDPQWVCLKVIKNNKEYFDQSLDEIKLLQYINSKGDPDRHHFLRLIDFFYSREHLVIVTELLRENLYDFDRDLRSHGAPTYYSLVRLKKIARQIFEALEYVHGLGLMHCDIKPENIVIKSYSRCEVKLIDFGSASFLSDEKQVYLQSRTYRAPEVVLANDYDGRIDMWSMGAVLAELHTGYVLFQNDSLASMLARIIGIVGVFPAYVLQEGRETFKYFTASGLIYQANPEGGFALVYPKKTTLRARLHVGPQATRDEEEFADFVGSLLDLDWRRRLTATRALQHPWLADAYDNDVYYEAA